MAILDWQPSCEGSASSSSQHAECSGEVVENEITGDSAEAGMFDDKGRAVVAHQARRLVETTGKLIG